MVSLHLETLTFCVWQTFLLFTVIWPLSQEVQPPGVSIRGIDYRADHTRHNNNNNWQRSPESAKRYYVGDTSDPLVQAMTTRLHSYLQLQNARGAADRGAGGIPKSSRHAISIIHKVIRNHVCKDAAPDTLIGLMKQGQGQQEIQDMRRIRELGSKFGNKIVLCKARQVDKQKNLRHDPKTNRRSRQKQRLDPRRQVSRSRSKPHHPGKPQGNPYRNPRPQISLRTERIICSGGKVLRFKPRRLRAMKSQMNSRGCLSNKVNKMFLRLERLYTSARARSRRHAWVNKTKCRLIKKYQHCKTS